MEHESSPSIKENLKRVLEIIGEAALRSGRKQEEIRLVTVTKTIEIGRVKEAVESGAKILGENYIQEAREKIRVVGENVEWHFIGHLQRRKAREAVELFDLIHSVDSFRLFEELNKRGEERGKKVRTLLQVNLSGEETKSGVRKEDVLPMTTKILDMENISLEGLMTMPPFLQDPEDVRPFFSNLKLLKERLSRETGLPLKELSMGMSHDFEVAIEEGATLVRVGTAIFGLRL